MLVVYPVPPFRLDLTVCSLRRLETNQIDRWDGQFYRRVLTLRNRVFEIAVEQPGPDPALVVRSRGISLGAEHRGHILPVLSRLLGWSVNSERNHGGLPSGSNGRKPFLFASPFETIINAFAGDQRTIESSIQITNRLGSLFGPHYGDAFGFVRATDLVKLAIKDLVEVGFSPEESGNILQLATGGMDFGDWGSLPYPELISQLNKLPGINSGMAIYVARFGYGLLA